MEDATPRFPFDPVYKALCCHRRTLRDMLQGYLAEPHGPLRHELIAALDLDTLRKVSMEWVTRDFRLRRGDQVWQVACTEAGRSRGYPAFLLLNLEFQSRRDGQMALRFLEQGGELVRELVLVRKRRVVETESRGKRPRTISRGPAAGKKDVLRPLSRAFQGGQRRCGSAFRCVRHRFRRTGHGRAPVVEPTCGDALKKASARLRS